MGQAVCRGAISLLVLVKGFYFTLKFNITDYDQNNFVMNYSKIFLLFSKKTVALSLIWTMAGSLSAAAQTPSIPTSRRSRALSPIVFSAPDLTGKGRPNDRQGAASRGRCSRNVNARKLLALVPNTEANPSIGLTLEERPTFLFSVPYGAENFYAIEFELLEPVEGEETRPHEGQEYNTFYQVRLTETASLPGIVSFRLPESAPPLELGKTYKWLVRFHCGEPEADYPDMPLFMGGSIIRVDPSEYSAGESEMLDRALSLTNSPRQRALVLARYGVWYDLLNEMANLRRTGDAIDDWQALLDEIKLPEMASQPLVDCCTSLTRDP